MLKFNNWRVYTHFGYYKNRREYPQVFLAWYFATKISREEKYSNDGYCISLPRGRKYICINSLAPGRFQFNFRQVIFKLILMNGGWGISYEIALRWMPLDLTDDKSTLVQVMAWCRQATSHYLSQCWLRSMSPIGVIRPQSVNCGLVASYVFVNITYGNGLLPDSTINHIPQAMLRSRQLHTIQYIAPKFWIQCKRFHPRNCILKWRLQMSTILFWSEWATAVLDCWKESFFFSFAADIARLIRCRAFHQLFFKSKRLPQFFLIFLIFGLYVHNNIEQIPVGLEFWFFASVFFINLQPSK